MRGASPLLLLAFGLSIGTAVVSLMACEDKGPPPPTASQVQAETTVRAKMGDLKHCWESGHKKKSYLAGEVQTLRMKVAAKGTVDVDFADPKNSKHPVGACMLSQLDGLRFAPSAAPATFDVPVRLGPPAG